MATVTRKVTALTKKGHPIVSLYVNDQETLEDVINMITDQLTQNSSRRAYLDSWIAGGYRLQCGEEE